MFMHTNLYKFFFYILNIFQQIKKNIFLFITSIIKNKNHVNKDKDVNMQFENRKIQ